jgi:aspartate aminotransferase
MIHVSPRVAALKTSPASVLAKRARELQSAGRDIILLSSGELDFATPPHVVEAANRAARTVPVGYTNVEGSAELKEAVREKFARENGIICEQDQIIICNGSKQVMFNGLMATIVAADEVIVPAPYWASYLDLVAFAGGTPVVAKTDGKLTPEGLEAAITPRTRWLILNNPVNPTGGVYSERDLRDLAQVLRRHPHVMVMSDDLYEHIVFDGAKISTMAFVAPDLMERTLTVNGVSKAYAMMGWRIGYGLGSRALIANMIKVQSQSTSNASTVSQAAAEAALRGPQTEIAKNLASLTTARSKVLGAVGRIPGLDMEAPAGTFYAFVSCESLLRSSAANQNGLRDDRDVARFLLDEAGVVVMPGADCGLSPYLRINFACDPAKLDRALVQIERAVGSIT